MQLIIEMPLWFGGDDGHVTSNQFHGRLSAIQTFDMALTQEELIDIIPEVPEPGSIMLALFGMMGLGFLRRR